MYPWTRPNPRLRFFFLLWLLCRFRKRGFTLPGIRIGLSFVQWLTVGHLTFPDMATWSVCLARRMESLRYTTAARALTWLAPTHPCVGRTGGPLCPNAKVRLSFCEGKGDVVEWLKHLVLDPEVAGLNLGLVRAAFIPTFFFWLRVLGSVSRPVDEVRNWALVCHRQELIK